MQLDIAGDCQVFIQAEALRHIADAVMHRRRVIGEIEAKDRDLPRGRAQQAGQQAEQGGFAGAIWPDDAGDHARQDGGVDPVQRRLRCRVPGAGEAMPQTGDRCERCDRLGHFPSGNRIETGIPWRSASSGVSTRMRRR